MQKKYYFLFLIIFLVSSIESSDFEDASGMSDAQQLEMDYSWNRENDQEQSKSSNDEDETDSSGFTFDQQLAV